MAVFSTIGTAVATAALGAAAAGTVGFTVVAGVTAAALQLAAGIAISLIGKQLAGEPDKAKFGVQGKLQGGEDVPRSINFGWNCTAGSLVYHNTWGTGSVLSTRVMAIGDYPVRSFYGFIVAGKPVTLGTAHANRGFPVLEYRKAGKDYLWIKPYDGTQNSADGLLAGSVASADRPYSSDRVGKGIPYIIVTALAPERTDGDDEPLFNGVPEVKAVTLGAKLYDISRDGSVGGTGAERWNTPATWGSVASGDLNPVVQLYNVLRGIRYGGEWLYGLQDLAASQLPAAHWIAGAITARTGIAAPGGGTEQRYRSGGEVQVGAQVKATIEALLTTCQGRLSEVGGIYKVWVGEPGAAVMGFSDDDIISTREQSFTPFYGLADTINGIDAQFYNPGEGWNLKALKPLRRPDLEELDGNRRLLASLTFDMVPYAAQCQRLMKSGLAEALRARRHTHVLGPEFRLLEPGDVAQWTSSTRNGYITKDFRVDGIVYLDNLDVMVDLTEVDPSDYDWDPDTDFSPVFVGPLLLTGPTAMPMQGWQVFPAYLPDNAGNPRRPSIEIRYNSGISNVARVRVQVRRAEETDWDALAYDGEIPYGAPWRRVLDGVFIPNTNYEVRGLFVLRGKGKSEWSGGLSVTTPDVRLGGLDIYEGVIGFEHLLPHIRELQEYATDRAEEALAEAKRIMLAATAQDIGNFRDFKRVERSVVATFERARASFTEAITLAVGPGGAIAQKFEELDTQLFDPVTGALTAQATALSVLTTEVHDPESGLGAATDSITSLTSAMGGSESFINIRFGTLANGPLGYSRYAVFGGINGTNMRQGGFGFDIPADVNLPAIFWIDMQQIVLKSGDVILALFTADGTLATARIPSLAADKITAGILRSKSGASFFDLETGAFRASAA